MPEQMQSDILYYDGACPLCRREINIVRRLTQHVDFVDVHQLSEAEIPASFSRPALLRDLHLLDRSGQWHIGLAANVGLWQRTRFGFIWRILQWPVIHPLAQWGYRWWADRRFTKMGYCADSVSCAPPSSSRVSDE
jgi:predicted DCC family thiol-disulfide oxidoreductase YuxK